MFRIAAEALSEQILEEDIKMGACVRVNLNKIFHYYI
jgi:hypothetical protein